jgi:hypothetical protein
MLIALILAGCTPDCDDGYGFADGECVPVDTTAPAGPANWGGGDSAALFYTRLIERYCHELRRCGAPTYQTDAFCTEFGAPGGYDYGYDYREDLIGCTVDPTQANLCISGSWTCLSYGDGYSTVQLPEACYAALDAQCEQAYGYDDEPYYYYGYYDY